MRRTLIVLLGIMLAIGALGARPGQPVSAAESDDLYAAINTYRQGLGLTAIPLSPQLTAVAQAHVRDLMANFATDPNYTGAGCIPHGWSNQGQWTGGCYKSADATTFPIMWNKPGEISNSPGNGFEILFGNGGGTVSAAEALQAWQGDPPHNDVIVNQGIWRDHPWQAIGVWVEAGWASVWFGEQTDPNATQPAAGLNGPPAAPDGLNVAPAAPEGAGTGTTTTGDGAAGTGNGTTTGDGATTGNGTTTGDGATTGNGTTAGNGATTGNDPAAPALPVCVDAEELAFLKLVNDHRAANGLEPFALSGTLSAAAKLHSQDMAAKNYFDHVGKDGSTFGQRIVAAGYPGNPTGENIFAGDQSAAGAFASWKNSPPHNANMLSTTSKAIGIGRAFDATSQWGWYWTTTFGETADAVCGGPVTEAPPVNATTGNGQDQPAGTGGNDGAGAQPGNGTTETGNNDGNAQPGNANPNADADGDGISDADETDFFGTNPQVFDTDGGGVGDGDEFFAGTNPLDPNDDNGGNGNAAIDSDGDGISDADETDFFGTDPQAFDTDGDGVGDGDEFFNGTDPFDPNSV
ncbi:MAG: hypothetical protein IT336_07335 [Thermomicrobiales bacterium]|nr:hypothetical protein [Thermomicrobiales bacterium]